jgi:hypothetical protein
MKVGSYFFPEPLVTFDVVEECLYKYNLSVEKEQLCSLKIKVSHCLNQSCDLQISTGKEIFFIPTLTHQMEN